MPHTGPGGGGGGGGTLAPRVRAVLRVVWLVSALPLDYDDKLRILRT